MISVRMAIYGRPLTKTYDRAIALAPGLSVTVIRRIPNVREQMVMAFEDVLNAWRYRYFVRQGM